MMDEVQTDGWDWVWTEGACLEKQTCTLLLLCKLLNKGLLIYSLIFNIASCTLSEDSDDLYLERFPKLDTCEWSDRAIEVVHYRGIIALLWFDEAAGPVLHTIKGAYISYDNADPWVLYCSYTKSLHGQFHHEMQWKVGVWLLWDRALLRPRFYNG